MGVGWGLLGLVDEAIERIGMLLGALAWEIGVMLVFEWPFILMVVFPCAMLLTRRRVLCFLDTRESFWYFLVMVK